MRERLKTERKILIESSNVPKKIWKKRKGEKGKKKSETKGWSRGIRARSREKIAILFFAHLSSPPPASPTRFSEIIDVKITGKDDSAFIVLRSNMVNGAPGAAKISTRVYDSSGLLPVFPAERFPSVDFDTMISAHGIVIASICGDRSRNCMHRAVGMEFCERLHACRLPLFEYFSLK